LFPLIGRGPRSAIVSFAGALESITSREPIARRCGLFVRTSRGLAFADAVAPHEGPERERTQHLRGGFMTASFNVERVCWNVVAATRLVLSLAGCGPAQDSLGESSSAFVVGEAYAFGARLDAYRFGIRPNHITSAQMDATIGRHYDEWKANLVVDVPSVPGGKAIKFNQTGFLAVSEGMGYGMLLTVLMAGHDPQAHAIFDGLLKTVRARPAYSIADPNVRPYLMDWRLAGDGSSNDAAGGGWNALDGDEDIAMALLMADRQWGSAGTWNYKQEGIRTINAMKSFNMKPDGTPMANLRTSRTSDYMIGHFRAFAAATGDSFWNTAIDRTYWLVERMQTLYSPNVGLVPDFIVDTDTANPRPSPGGQIESPWEGRYFSNGQRDPWRWASDYVYSGDARWKNVLTKMSTFFVKDNGGTPGIPGTTWEPIGNMAIGYHLDGARMNSEFSNPWPARGVVAGAMNGAQVDATFQSYVNACWDWLDAKWVASYYDAELTLLSMIVASGNWWTPTPTGSTVSVPPPSPSTSQPPGPTPSAPPPPPAPISPSTTTRIQAENGTLSGSGVAVRSDLKGFEGSGFAGTFTNPGDKLTVTFGSIVQGIYDVRIRYHAWTAQQNDVVINGASRNTAFPATGGDWQTLTLGGLLLAGGTTTIAILKDWGYIDVDYLELATGDASSSPPPPPPPPTAPSTIRLEAEIGAISGSGVSVRTDLTGYEGAAFVGTFTANGDKLSLSYANVVAGTYDVHVRYHAWTDQHNDVIVNGAARDQFFPATGSGWGTATVSTVSLQNGMNTIAFSKNWGYTDVDWIEIVPMH
jgi:hypothetical protein